MNAVLSPAPPSLNGRTLAVVHGHCPFSLGPGYLLALLAEYWRAAGLRLIDVAGRATPPAADLLLMHVDLSVVPEPLLALARPHPGAINAHVADIRKEACLEQLLNRRDASVGPVMVKSSLNHAGVPERLSGFAVKASLATRLRRGVGRLLGQPPPIREKSDYRVYPSLADVPRCRFHDGSVVQRFLPERRGAKYVLREYYFLGDRHFLSVESGDDPILTSGEVLESGPGLPPDDVLAVRARMGIDYGKIDYGIVDGRAVVYDVNKTIGTRPTPTATTRALAGHLAPGLLDFLT